MLIRELSMSKDQQHTTEPPLTLNERGGSEDDLSFLHDVLMEIVVEFGSAECAIRKILGWKVGDVLTLDQQEGSPLGIRVNGRLAGSGEAVVVNDRYGIRVTGICDPEIG
jgi:flagellar motor switch protein FliN/FliY